MSQTLNQLITSAILGGEEAEEQALPPAEAVTEPSEVSPGVLEEAEKLASALEFMGRRGIGSLLEKTAGGGACLPPGTNMGQTHASRVEKQVPPNAFSSPMNPGKKSGPVETNAGKKPGLPSPAGGIDTTKAEHGTHVPQLGSNEAAIGYDKRVKAQRVAPALDAVLDAKAFADPKLRENISGAAGKGDKNIKTAHDAEAVRAELARRVAEGRNS